MSKPIRLSPSGPNIENSGGAPLAFGTGARLRLVEAALTCAAGNVIPTSPATIGDPIGSSTFFVELDAPDAAKGYRCNVRCDVENPTTNAAGEIQLYIETSVDLGTSWQLQASNTHTVNPSTVSGTTRQIELGLPLVLGSVLGVTGTATSLWFRAKIGASSGTTNVLLSAITPGQGGRGNGTIHLEAQECF